MKVRHALAAAGVALSIFGSGSALAAGFFTNYDLTIAPFNGSAATFNRAKASAFDRAVVCSTTVGGNYTVDVRVERNDNAARSGWVTITDFTRADLTYTSAIAGQSYHARFSNNFNTPVNVQVLGKWSPDNPGICSY